MSRPTPKGGRYGVSAAQADEMDRVYSGALEVAQKHSRLQREERGISADAALYVKGISAPRPRGVGVGALCERLILEGKTDEQALAAAQAQLGKGTIASVRWYRNKLRKEGRLS